MARRAAQPPEGGDELPRKRQATLGEFSFTRNGSRPPPPPATPAFACPHCCSGFLSLSALVSHERWCPSSPMSLMVAADEEKAMASSFAAYRLELPSFSGSSLSRDDREKEAEEESAEEEERPGDQSKEKKKRHSYPLKMKVKTLELVESLRDMLALTRGVARNEIPLSVLIDKVEKETGIPSSTVKKWVLKAARLKEAWQTKTTLKSARRLGVAGRKPFFPEAEKKAGKEARDRRKENLIVTKGWMYKKVVDEAKNENPGLAAKQRFGIDFFLAFLRRQGLALRVPSCTKPMSLENGILTCRGFFQWLRKLIRDEFGQKHAKEMHPEEGRFLFRLRYNKDEVRTSSHSIHD